MSMKTGSHMGHAGRRRPQAMLMPLLLALNLASVGCMGIDDPSGMTQIVSNTTPERVVMKIINNSCGEDESVGDAEDVSTGEVQGLAKVIDGFGIPYDERADSYTTHPSAVTDASYDANKERGVGYAGIEDHYVAALKAGQEHSPDHPEHADVGAAMFTDLTTKEEQYGCAMRWEYYNPDLSGPAVDGYMDFLKGNGSGHMQYVAIHATVSDKWVICCPYDWGPALNLPTTGGGKYANGRIGGLSPAAAEALEIDGGDGPENAMTEWWWVTNSSQVECGPVDNLSELEKTKAGAGADSSSSGTSSAQVSTSSPSKTGGSEAVSVAPANPNSFKQHMRGGYAHGSLPKNKVMYIVIKDTGKGSDDLDKYLNGMGDGPQSSHFVVARDGTIAQCVPLNKIARHAGDAPAGANAQYSTKQERDDEKGAKEGMDHGMDAWSIGIALIHKEDEGKYPEAQMNALDKLVAYIDEQVGAKPKIIRDTQWQGKKDTQGTAQFPSREYGSSRNHNGVQTEDDAAQAAEEKKCSDEDDDAGGKAIAEMAVKISGTASPTEPIYGGWNEKPTDSRLAEYVKAKQKAYPDGYGWADGSRCAATAVKASGADNSFPEGDATAQLSYMKNSPKWKRTGTMRTGDSPSYKCKPGDVLVTESNKGHAMIYVGNDAVKEKYPDSNANFFEGSYNTHYGWCYRKKQSDSPNDYAIYRCVKPDSGQTDDEAEGEGDTSDIIEWGKTQVGVTAYGEIGFINPYIGKNPEWADYAAQRSAESYKTIAGTTDPNGASTDCFGFTFYCYTSAGYTDYPDHAWGGGGAKEQVEAAGNFTTDPSALQPGDLVFWENCPHIGIYYGEVDGVPSVIHNAHGVDIEPLETVNGYCGGFTGGGFPYDRAKQKQSSGGGGSSGIRSAGAEAFVKACQEELADWEAGRTTAYRYTSWLFPDTDPNAEVTGWCAIFMGYCAHKIGSCCANGPNENGDAFPGEVSWPGHWREYYQQHPDRGEIRRHDGATLPNVGDLIIWGDVGSHVEMVDSVDPATKSYTTIGGGAGVFRSTRSVQDMIATWVITPNWSLLGYSGGTATKRGAITRTGVLSGKPISGNNGAELLIDSCRQEFIAHQQKPVGWKYQEDMKELAEKKDPGCSSLNWNGQCSEFCWWNLYNIGLKPGEQMPDNRDLGGFGSISSVLEKHPDLGKLHNVGEEPDFVPQPGDIAFQGGGVHFEVVLTVNSDSWTSYASGGPSVDNNTWPIDPSAGIDKYGGYRIFFRYDWDKLGLTSDADESEDNDVKLYVDVSRA